jgi:antitoxin ParD1/3/4
LSVKTSISLTASQEAYAREMVAQGRYPSLSAVLQHGLELLKAETEARDAELAALRALLVDRRAGGFVSVEAGRDRTEQMLARKSAGDGL